MCFFVQTMLYLFILPELLCFFAFYGYCGLVKATVIVALIEGTIVTCEMWSVRLFFRFKTLSFVVFVFWYPKNYFVFREMYTIEMKFVKTVPITKT